MCVYLGVCVCGGGEGGGYMNILNAYFGADVCVCVWIRVYFVFQFSSFLGPSSIYPAMGYKLWNPTYLGNFREHFLLPPNLHLLQTCQSLGRNERDAGTRHKLEGKSGLYTFLRKWINK